MFLRKDAKYTFLINKEEREKFKTYCRVMNVSPSDLLGEVVFNFNRDAEQIIKMKEIDELQAMLECKYVQGKKEIDALKAERK